MCTRIFFEKLFCYAKLKQMCFVDLIKETTLYLSFIAAAIVNFLRNQARVYTFNCT